MFLFFCNCTWKPEVEIWKDRRNPTLRFSLHKDPRNVRIGVRPMWWTKEAQRFVLSIIIFNWNLGKLLIRKKSAFGEHSFKHTTSYMPNFVPLRVPDSLGVSTCARTHIRRQISLYLYYCRLYIDIQKKLTVYSIQKVILFLFY